MIPARRVNVDDAIHVGQCLFWMAVQVLKQVLNQVTMGIQNTAATPIDDVLKQDVFQQFRLTLTRDTHDIGVGLAIGFGYAESGQPE